MQYLLNIHPLLKIEETLKNFDNIYQEFFGLGEWHYERWSHDLVRIDMEKEEIEETFVIAPSTPAYVTTKFSDHFKALFEDKVNEALIYIKTMKEVLVEFPDIKAKLVELKIRIMTIIETYSRVQWFNKYPFILDLLLQLKSELGLNGKMDIFSEVKKKIQLNKVEEAIANNILIKIDKPLKKFTKILEDLHFIPSNSYKNLLQHFKGSHDKKILWLKKTSELHYLVKRLNQIFDFKTHHFVWAEKTFSNSDGNDFISTAIKGDNKYNDTESDLVKALQELEKETKYALKR